MEDARYNPDKNEACAQLEVVVSYSVELTELLNVEIQLTEEHPAIEISPFNNHGVIDILDDDSTFFSLGLRHKFSVRVELLSNNSSEVEHLVDTIKIFTYMYSTLRIMKHG